MAYRWEARSTTPGDYRWTSAAIAELVGGGSGTYTDPGIANVRKTVTYTYDSTLKTGTLENTDPGVGNVRRNTTYIVNNETLTGTYGLGDVDSDADCIEKATVDKILSIDAVKDVIRSRAHYSHRPVTSEGEQVATGLPCIVLRRVGTERDETLSGASGLTTARFQVDCLAADMLDAIELAEAVRLYLPCEVATWGTVSVDSATVGGDRDIEYDASDLEAASVYGRQLDLEIVFQENV